jgi:hypothetical protein
LDAHEKGDFVIDEKLYVLWLREKRIIDKCLRQRSSYLLEKEMMRYGFTDILKGRKADDQDTQLCLIKTGIIECGIIAREKDAVSIHFFKIIKEKIGMIGHIQCKFSIKL